MRWPAQRATALECGGKGAANEAVWQVAQAISEVLPDGDKEKQGLQGLLYSRKA